jgi:D-glycero-beta-D-manno-heptose 1-phosphate adenylyltransferase
VALLTIDEAKRLRQGKRLVFTNGVFDLLHAGHVTYLEEAKKLGDLLLVGVHTDASVKRLQRGPNRPINSQSDRALIVDALQSVDGVLLYEEATSERLLRALRPDVYVKGGDYSMEDLPEAKIVQTLGGDVMLLPLLAGRSTTSILRKLNQGIRVFDPDPSLRWLFCMTHPDDEISICVWIRRLTDQGNEVFLSWTHDTEVRRSEAYRAADSLGVPRDRLFFHAAEDRKAIDHLPELSASFERMMDEVEPDRVACGAYEQGHIDHDTTNYLVNRTFFGHVFEIPFYFTYLTRRPKINRFAVPDGQEVLRLTPEEQKFKVWMAKQYPSQAIFRNLLLAEARQRLTRLRPDRLRATERMRLQVHKDFLVPNLPERYAKYVVRSRHWRRWEAKIRDFEGTAPAGGLFGTEAFETSIP